MIKKTLIIATIALLFCSMVIPTTVVAEDNEVKKTASMASFITVDWETLDEPIMPVDEIRYFDINITYDITQGGLISNLLLPFFMGKQVDINLDIIDKSKWCTANLVVSTLTTLIGDEEKNMTTKLAIELDKDAPAYEAGYVTLNVSIEPFKGPLGLITFIDGYTQEFTVKFMPDYVGIIDPEPIEGDFYEIAPYNTTIIPIDIKNLGNGETYVIIEIVNSSDSFDLFIQDRALIDVGDNQTVYLTIKADHNFDEEEIKIEFTPVYSNNHEITGSSITTTLTLKNDGSYVEEEDGIEIDTTTILIILVIIILLIGVLILLKKKKE